jgi:hypothetical protein
MNKVLKAKADEKVYKELADQETKKFKIALEELGTQPDNWETDEGKCNHRDGSTTIDQVDIDKLQAMGNVEILEAMLRAASWKKDDLEKILGTSLFKQVVTLKQGAPTLSFTPSKKAIEDAKQRAKKK